MFVLRCCCGASRSARSFPHHTKTSAYTGASKPIIHYVWKGPKERIRRWRSCRIIKETQRRTSKRARKAWQEERSKIIEQIPWAGTSRQRHIWHWMALASGVWWMGFIFRVESFVVRHWYRGETKTLLSLYSIFRCPKPLSKSSHEEQSFQVLDRWEWCIESSFKL